MRAIWFRALVTSLNWRAPASTVLVPLSVAMTVALTAALSRTQGGKRFTTEVLLNSSGFAGIDGLFRFRADGTNERGLAVMRVTSNGPSPVAGSPKSFGA